MDYTGFANAFTEGEISPDAWDRVDIQPVGHGVEAGINCTVMALGPLRKRRGFFRCGSVADPTKPVRLVPFRRSLDDALMLEFGDSVAHVWQLNGAPLLDGPDQVSFATPYSTADLPKLRWRQVANVLYFRTRDGQAAQILTRTDDQTWSFAAEAHPNGPWLPENTAAGWTLTVSGTDETGTNAAGSPGSILVGTAVTLVSSQALFDARHVGGTFRTRAGNGGADCAAWTPGQDYPAGFYVESAGHVYRNTAAGATGKASNPPVHLQGSPAVSDGSNTWDYRHDGAGVIKITAVTDSTNAAGTVLATHPLRSAVATSFWSEGAYSSFRGHPRAWPALREERLVGGSTASNLDILDLSETAGFDTASANYHPGTGVGTIIATDAIRVRLGDSNGEIVWCAVANYLLCGAVDAEYLVAGSVLDEPLDPAAGGGVTIKKLSQFGSYDHQPALVWNGLAFIQRGGQALRFMSIDTQQGFSKEDFGLFAGHLTQLGLAQLAWLPQDQLLWIRTTADAGLVSMAYHQEQAVRGWTRHALHARIEDGAVTTDFAVEDVVGLPGPGELETLWLVVSRVLRGVTQRAIWQQAQPSDGLFIDGAFLFEGAPASSFAGMDDYAGTAVKVLADGAEYDALVVGDDGVLTLPDGAAAASKVYAGYGYLMVVKSLQLSRGLSGGSLHERQRIAGAVVSLLTANATFGLAAADDASFDFGGATETVSSRTTAGVVPFGAPARVVREVTFGGDGGQAGRDPRILIVDRSAYDCILYSIKPKATAGG